MTLHEIEEGMARKKNLAKHLGLCPDFGIPFIRYNLGGIIIRFTYYRLTSEEKCSHDSHGMLTTLGNVESDSDSDLPWKEWYVGQSRSHNLISAVLFALYEKLGIRSEKLERKLSILI